MKEKRLELLLKVQGYSLAYSNATGEVLFVRRCPHMHELFERLSVHGSRDSISGRWNAFWSAAELSIVPGCSAVKEICKSRTVTGLPFASSRSTSILNDDDMAKAWEMALAEGLPDVRKKLLEEEAENLKRSTSELRRVCQEYYTKLDRNALPMESLERIKKQINPVQRSLVENIQKYPVVTIPNNVTSYQIAIGLICLFANDIEPANQILSVSNPYEDRRLFLRLQVLASRIAHEKGWDEQ